MRVISVIGLFLMAGAASAQTPPSPLPLDWCLERAAEANPLLARDAASRDEARERILPAGSLEDPRLAYEASNIPIEDLDFDSTPLSGKQFGLRQRLPFPGLLRNRERAARAAFQEAESSLENRHLLVQAAVERAWANLGFAQRALAITDQNIALLRQLTEIAEAKYRVGQGLQQDVLRAQVELTDLLEERLQREASVVTAAAQLAELLDLPSDVTLPETAPLEDAASIPEVDALIAGLVYSTPPIVP